MDNATLTKSRMMYARVLVDMTLAGGFPEELFFSNEHDHFITQCVQYDWLPSWCTKCEKLVHVVDGCRLCSKTTQLQVDENGFRPLRKTFQAKVGSKTKGAAVIGQKDDLGVGTDECEDNRVATDIPAFVQHPIEADSNLPTADDLLDQQACVAADVSFPSSSNSMVSKSSLILHNGFNVLSMECDIYELDNSSVVIALGADSIEDNN